MSSAITTAGQARISELMGTEQALVIDRMVLALIPDLDASQAVDRDQQLPDPAHIVHTADIADENKGYVGPDEVVYSIVLGSDLGDFSFNWIGTLEKDTDTVITVTTTPETPKRKTNLPTNTTGNCITRNVILAFQNAQAVTGITVTAQTWQFDYEAAFALHAAGAVDPSQEGDEHLHITNTLAKAWDDGIKSNTTRLGAFENSTSLLQEFEPNKIQAELFATGYTLYEKTETTWEVDLINGSALAVDGGVYEAHGLNVYDLNQNKAAVVRRTDNDGILNAFFRDAAHPAWTSCEWEWKRDAGNGMIDVEYQVPARGPFDMRFESAAGASAVDPMIDHIIFVECEPGKGGIHRPPATPTIVFPANGATGITEQPSLTTGAFVSPVDEAPQGVRFQIASTADFTDILVDAGIVPGVSWSPDKGVLDVSTSYYARALHADVAGGISEWSPAISFTTAATFITVNKPTCITPAAGAELGTPDGLTLVSSAFSSSGGDDTHINSQFQLANDPGATDIIHDSGADDINLISYNVPDSTVTRGQTFYWRVRHEGETGGWSDWSISTVFSVSIMPPVEDIFSTYIYTGDAASRDIINGVDLSNEDGMVWIKNRDTPSAGSGDHMLFDTVRGFDGSNNALGLNTNEVYAQHGYSEFDSFNLNGFSIGNGEANQMGKKFVSWAFRKAEKFFDIVTWQGDGTNGRQIPHNLGCAPGMAIIKNLTDGSAWPVWHNAILETESLYLNTSNTKLQDNYFGAIPTDSFFSVRADPGNGTNENGDQYIAYLFAHDPSDKGLIQCGAYTGNGNVIGPAVNLGWEPQFLLIKCADYDGYNWFIFDNQRNPSDPHDLFLEPNTPDEESGGYDFHFTESGFEVHASYPNVNKLNNTFVYMAIRKPAI